MEQWLKVVAGVLLVVVVAVYAWWYWPSGETLESPEVLAGQALSAAKTQDQELACARLVVVAGKLGKSGTRNPAREALLRVFKQSKTPTVQGAALRGLASIWDYDSMGLLLDALGNDSVEVRAAAGQAVTSLLCQSREDFNPRAPPEQRKSQVQRLREQWKGFTTVGKGGLSRLDIWKETLAKRDQ
ncbi:MAG: HEAT repeat domain-containing protein [Thermoguttaceae bacterium]|jgi:hypothetical protein